MLVTTITNQIIGKTSACTFSLTKRGKAIEARLHTAVSEGLVYSIISVHRLEDLIVPRFCWLLFLLQVSCISLPFRTRPLDFSVRTHICDKIMAYLEAEQLHPYEFNTL